MSVEMPRDVAHNFERLYRDAEEYNVKAIDGRPLAFAWIDRFKRVYCAGTGYTNVAGMSYFDFRAEFMRVYRMDHDYVSQTVAKMQKEKPRLFEHGFSAHLIEEFKHI